MQSQTQPLVLMVVGLALALTALIPVRADGQVPDPSVVPLRDTQLRTPQSDQLRVVLNVKASGTQRRLPGVRVAVFDQSNDALVAVDNSDAMGTVTIDLPFEGSYRFETCAENFLAGGAVVRNCCTISDSSLMCVEGLDFFTYDDAAPKTGVDHLLLADLELDSLAVGQIVDLDHILYDYDKATLRAESQRELDQLIRALEQLPGLGIELRSHTDSRGTDDYNQDLSQRRAQSVVDYLIAKGISPERFTARGFGESRLVNACADGVACTEAQHQRNRRTEFEVKAYEPAPCPDLPLLTAGR